MSEGIRCPYCKSFQSSVIDTRKHQAGIRRRRKCRCGFRYSTEERIETLNKGSVPLDMASNHERK